MVRVDLNFHLVFFFLAVYVFYNNYIQRLKRRKNVLSRLKPIELKLLKKSCKSCVRKRLLSTNLMCHQAELSMTWFKLTICQSQLRMFCRMIPPQPARVKNPAWCLFQLPMDWTRLLTASSPRRNWHDVSNGFEDYAFLPFCLRSLSLFLSLSLSMSLFRISFFSNCLV